MMSSRRTLPPFHFIPRRFPSSPTRPWHRIHQIPMGSGESSWPTWNLPFIWMNNVQTLWNEYGVRPSSWRWARQTLCNLIADTLPEPACIQTCLPSAEGPDLQDRSCQLFVQGHLKVEGEQRFVSFLAFRKLLNLTEPLQHPR